MRKHFLILMLLTLLPFTAWADDLSQGKIVIPSTYYGYAPTCTSNNATTEIKVYNKVNVQLTKDTDFTFDGFFSDPQCNNALTEDEVKALDALTTVYVKVTGINTYEKSLINTFEIKKVPLTVEHVNPATTAYATKVFGETDPTTLFTVNKVKEKITGTADRTETFNNKITFTRDDGEDAGSYDFIATITDATLAKNYTIESTDIKKYDSDDQLQFVITPKAFNATNIDATLTANLTYNGKAQKATVVVKDIARNEILTEKVLYTATDPEVIAGTKNVGDVKVAGDYSLAWAENTNAGTNTASVIISGARNYAGALAAKTFSIKKAPLLVIPSGTKVYDGYAGLKNGAGDDDNMDYDDIQYEYQGFVDAKTAADVTVGAGTKIAVTSPAKDVKADYELKITTAAFSITGNNYEFKPQNGLFSITPKEITFTVDDAEFNYGEDEDYELTDAWEATVPAGNNANDKTNLPKIIKIERAEAKVGGVGEHKDDYELTACYLTDDEINALAGLNDNQKAELIKTKKNYDATFVGNYATITKATLYIALKQSGYTLEKIYDGQPVSVTLDKTTTGLTILGKVKQTDVVNIDALELNVVDNSANVGTYQLVLSGATAENYDIVYIPSQYKIKKRPVTVTVHDQIFVKGTVPTLNADLYTIEDTEAEVEGIVDADKGKVFKLQLDGAAAALNIDGEGKIQADANNTYEAIQVVDVEGTDSRYANYNIFVGNDAPASAVIVYTAVANLTPLTAGNTYYTSNTGAGEFVALGTEVANGTNYFELEIAQRWGRAIVKAAAQMLTIDDTKNIKANLIAAASFVAPATAPDPVNITFSNRTLKAGVWYTLVLPFDITVSKFSKAFGYAVVDMFDQTASDGKVHFNLYMGNIPANTPFMFKIDGEKLNLNQVYIEEQTIIYDPEATEPREGVLFDEIGNPYVIDGSNNKLVGFYGKKAADITAPEEGDNMLAPSEYYLNGSGVWTPAGSNGATIGGERAKLVLATNAREILVEEPDGSTTAIACINAEGVAVEANGWYTLDGVKLQGAPTEKGVYIRNGKKMVIK